MSDPWQERNKPARLEQRYLFKDYNTLRDFLERAAELSEREDFFPNTGFGKDYVNITIYAEEDSEQVSESQRRFAEELDKLFNAKEN